MRPEVHPGSAPPDKPGIPGLLLPEGTTAEKSRVEHWLAESMPAGTRAIVLHIGAGNHFRDWGEDNLGTLITRLLDIPEIRVILAGAGADAPRARRLLRHASDRLRSAAGLFNLRELRELLSRSALFVGADSGPMHIAAAAGTPIVALFGPTRPAHFAPWKAEAVIIQKELDCRPCRQRECRHGDYRCLQTITPDEVFEACRGILE